MFCRDLKSLLIQAPLAAARFLSGRRSVILLKHREAVGDSLMMSALARALKKHRPDLRLAIATLNPELFAHNPRFDEVRDWHLFRTPGTVRVNYRLQNAGHEHYVEDLWLTLWEGLSAKRIVSGPCPPLDGRHPEIFLTEAERARGRERLAQLRRPVVALISGGKTRPTHNREWGYENYAALAEALEPHVGLLQVSGERELVLPGRGLRVPNLRLPTRELAAVLAECDAFLTQEGGLMHVARAVETPSVVIYGGTLLPQHSGYDRMTNLYSRPECSPCRHTRLNCAHLKCMLPITPRVVAEAIGTLLAKRGFVLPPEALQAAPDQWTPPEFVDRALLAAELAAPGKERPRCRQEG